METCAHTPKPGSGSAPGSHPLTPWGSGEAVQRVKWSSGTSPSAASAPPGRARHSPSSPGEQRREVMAKGVEIV